MILRNFFPILAAVLVMLALAACEKPQDKEARYIRQGNELFERGEYDKARLEYKNAARIMPGDAEPRYRLGLVDEAQGDLRNAFGNFTAAEQQSPHYRLALLKLAQYYMAAEQLEQSQKRLDIVLADAPDDPQAHALNAALLLKKKDFAATEKEARFALEKDPANVTAISVLAGLYIEEKDNAKAATVLEDGIKRNPRELALLILKVVLYERADNLDKIAETYQAIFRLVPKDVRYRSMLAETYRKAGNMDKAEATLRDGIAALPGDWAIKKELVDFLGANRGVDAAEKEIRSLMEANPRNDDLYFWLADLYITHNATDRAEALLKQIIDKNQYDPTGLDARTSLARIQMVKGNRALASKLTAAVLENAPGNQEARLIRAGLAFDDGNYQDAVSDLRTLIRDDPKAKEAYRLLAEALLQQGHLDLAIDTLHQLLDADSTDRIATVRLAQMYVMNGNPKRARELLLIVTKAYPAYPVGWESTARVAIGMKDWPGAEAAIKTLDAISGQHMITVFLQAQIYAYSGRIDDAIPLYVQVINADPSAPLAQHALSELAETYQSQNRLQDAVNTIRSLKGDTALMNSLIGECLVKLGKPDEAAAAFDKAIAQNAAFPAPYAGRAGLYLRSKDSDKAIQLLKQSREKAPSDMLAPMMEAGILGKLGRYQEAIDIYDGMLARNPGLDVAANNMAQIIADYQYTDPIALDKARQTAERFINSSNPFFLDTLGWVYFRQGNLQQAQTIMERAAAFKTKMPPEAHYHYGCLLLKVGKSEEARAELKQAVVEGASYNGLEDARKLLASLGGI